MKIGGKLLGLREKIGKSRREVIEDLKEIYGVEIGDSTLKTYENDRSEPTFEVLGALAKYYNVSVAYLFSETEEELSQKETNTILIDSVLEGLIRGGYIKRDQKIEELPEDAREVLFASIQQHINKLMAK